MIDDNALMHEMTITNALRPNAAFTAGYYGPRDRKTSFIRRTLPARHREIFFPVAFSTKVRKLRVGDFEVVRGQASLTAEARRTRVFCSVSLNFSVFRLFALPTSRSRFPARSVRPSVSSASPVRLAADSGGVRRYYLSCEYQTRAGARHCIIIYLPTL